ncbi:phage tail tape measure protein [Streptomyces sp. CC208A]|uniref:phage tail tape measure protein n=1 Tax=Streptomyces sp. CC208A TaxID=3044573 RepID=UPI0024A8742F|nr:phage tail tape measure protein [Streptomyces sp. CC208A]
MALTVGELNAVLSVDDRAVEPSLRRTERALRTAGQRMGNEAERAGEDVGEELGESIVRGADGRLRNARGRFVAAGRRAGEAVGDALADEAAAGADEAVKETGSRLERLKMLAAGVGLAAGAVLAAGISQALEQSRITSRLGAQLGKTPAEAQRYGKIAGKMYADAVTEDFQTAADAISATMRAGIAPPGATEAQLQSLATKVTDLASTFELDLGQTANAVGQAIKTGLAKDGVEALDVFTRGMQIMGPRADDLMDTFNEYSTIFRQTGIDAKTATGLLSQGMKAGARDTDVIADALKEFVLITQAGEEKADEAFKTIGLSGKEMQKAFIEGGPGARKALDQVFDRLRGMKDPAERSAVALELFGTKSEDTQKALFALDPSAAVDALGGVGGAADKMGDTLRDNAGVRVEQFKRQAMQGLVDFLGARVIPAIEKAFTFVREHSTEFKIAALVITGVLIPALALLAVTATVKMGVVVWAWMTSGAASLKAAATHVGSALTTAGAWAMMALRATGSFLATAASATANALRTAAAWAAAGVRMTVTFLAAVLRVTAVTLAQFALMAARAVAWAATMAAQWLIAMGPIGWIILAVGALVTAIIVYWDEIKAATVAAWDWLVKTIKQFGLDLIKWFTGWPIWATIAKHWQSIKDGSRRLWDGLMNWLRQLPGRILGFFAGWSIAAMITRHWQGAKDGAIRQGRTLLDWMRNLPREIGRAVGKLGSLLIGHGRDVVRGLWDGIKGMGGWIKSKILSWARSVIPGPIARALGIASPSKVTAEQGRWIARGLVLGLTGSTKQVQAAALRLSDIVRDALKPGPRRAGLQRQIDRSTARLMQLANAEATVANKLKAANKRLQDLLKARADLVANVRSGILDAANITQDTENGVTGASILANLQDDLRRAKQFAADLGTLRKKGVRADLISQIAQAGVEQGGATAAALAAASSGQIQQINDTQKQLVGAANKAGNAAGDAMYGAGIRAAQGLVEGLKKEQSAIERQMLTIATAMQKAIKQALGIKSPSRVMAAVGRFIPAGLVRGIESGRSAVDASMSNLVKPPTPTAVAGAYGGAGMPAATGRAQAPTVIEIRSGGSRMDDLLVEVLRNAVKDRGGDVQLALGQRR